MLWSLTMNNHPPAKTPDIGSIKDSVETLLGQGSQTVDAIRSRVTEVTDDAKGKASAVYDQVVTFIKAHPGKSVALAFGLGYVAMRIRTSKLFPLAVIGGLGYLAKRGFAQPATSGTIGPGRSST